MEPITRVAQLLPASRPGIPVRSLATGPAQAVFHQGRSSGRVVPVAFHPAGRSPGPLPVALTFDDGPWPHTTERILAILAQRQAPATFFVVGRQVQHFPELVRQELRAGMAVGSHSYGHPQSFDRLPVARIRDEITHGRRTCSHWAYARWGSDRRAEPPPRPSWQWPRGSATAPCCGVSTQATGSRMSPPNSSSSACLPGSDRAQSCCSMTVVETGRPPWRPYQASSMGCAAWALLPASCPRHHTPARQPTVCPNSPHRARTSGSAMPLRWR
jgi:Polysaccharide deacetylase